MSDVVRATGNLGDQGVRLARVSDLVDAIHACHPEDAEYVMAVMLEEGRCDCPLPQFDAAESDAEFWAMAASFDYLRAVFIAAGRQLVRYPLGVKGRQRMIKRMLEGMSAKDRRSTLKMLSESEESGHDG